MSLHTDTHMFSSHNSLYRQDGAPRPAVVSETERPKQGDDIPTTAIWHSDTVIVNDSSWKDHSDNILKILKLSQDFVMVQDTCDMRTRYKSAGPSDIPPPPDRQPDIC